MWGLTKDEAMYAHQRGFVTDDQANAFIDFNTMHHDMNQQAGHFVLDMLSAGHEKDYVLAEFEGLGIPMYGPEDLVADLLTGGLVSVMRTGIKGGAKVIGKEMVKDAAFGAIAGGAMTGAGFLTDSGAVQMLSGLITPLGASVVLGMGRNGLKVWLKDVRTRNPKLADELKAVSDQYPDDEFMALVRAELDEADLGVTKRSVESELEIKGQPYEPKPIRPEDVKRGEQVVDIQKRAEGVEKASGEETLKTIGVLDAIRKGDSDPKASTSKLVQRIEADGQVEAVDIIEEVRKGFSKEIDEARGGEPNAKGTRVDWDQQQKEANRELRKMSEWTGSSLKDMKEVVGWGCR
jgi:hypothetical protein